MLYWVYIFLIAVGGRLIVADANKSIAYIIPFGIFLVELLLLVLFGLKNHKGCELTSWINIGLKKEGEQI